MVREHKEVRLNQRTSTNRWEVVRLAEDGRVITDRWPLHEEDSNLLNALLARFAAVTTEHTPTTEEIRTAYVLMRSTGRAKVLGDMLAEFDRWLAGIRAEVAEQVAQAIERRKRDMAGGYTGDARAMLEIGMDTAARIARQPYDRYTKQPL